MIKAFANVDVMNSSYYLDYNATAPLSESFKQALYKGEIPEGNFSSIHSAGKKLARAITEVEKQIFDYFELTSKSYDILFHSGATEAANTFIRPSKGSCLLYSVSDHPCVTALVESLSIDGVHCEVFSLDNTGHFIESDLIAQIHKLSQKYSDIYLHFTHLHNETGVIWDLEAAERIKEQTGCFVYVDAVQLPGKVLNKEKLSPKLDVYTFSGHKFGALKGIGFSFVKKGHVFFPLIKGGGQQRGKRSGTLNTHGVFSLGYAIEELESNLSKRSQVANLKNKIVRLAKDKTNLQVIENSSINTICFVHNSLRADVLFIHFDMNGLCVSPGSACASGSTAKGSPTLEAMGFGEKSSNAIRISIGIENLDQEDEMMEKLISVFNKL